MILPFYLDDNFFNSPYLYDENLDVMHDSFLNFWKNYGILIISKEKSILYYLEKIKDFPPIFQQSWKEAFNNFLIYKLEDLIIESFMNVNNDYSYYFNFKDILNFGLTDLDGFHKIIRFNNYNKDSCVQIMAFDNYSKSTNYQKIINMSKSIDVDSDRQIVWNERFKFLGKHTNNIKVIDRFFYKNLREDNTIRDTHFKNFLSLLLQNSIDKINFTIFSAGGDEKSDEKFELLQYFEKNIINSPPLKRVIGSLTLYSNPDSFFKPKSHDRYIVFDKHATQLGSGFQLFRNFPISRTACVLECIDNSLIPKVLSEANSEKLWKETLI